MPKENPVKHKPVPTDDLPNIGKVARRELARAGYTRLEQFSNVSEKELLKLHGVGPKAIRILREALEMNGLTFASNNRETKG